MNYSTESVKEIEFCRQFYQVDQVLNNTNCSTYLPLQRFDVLYKEVHGYLSAIICVFGVVNNIINSIVLTQKTMVNPINLILFGIALSDMIKMTSYSIYTIYLNLLTSPIPCDYPHSYHWVLFILLHSSVVICTHTVSTLLVVTLASFRAWTLTNITSDNRMQNWHSYCAIIIISSVSFLFAIPNYFMEDIFQFYPTYFWFKNKDWGYTQKNIHFAFYGCVVKILCSIILMILTVTIIVVMKRSGRRKQRLLAKSRNLDTDDKELEYSKRGKFHHNPRDPYHKATMLLLAVMMSFVITEVPQGIINTLTAMLPCFLDNVYIHIGDIMDIFVLVNSSINFILYCSMSQQFRDTFRQLFCRCAPIIDI